MPGLSRGWFDYDSRVRYGDMRSWAGYFLGGTSLCDKDKAHVLDSHGRSCQWEVISVSAGRRPCTVRLVFCARDRRALRDVPAHCTGALGKKEGRKERKHCEPGSHALK